MNGLLSWSGKTDKQSKQLKKGEAYKKVKTWIVLIMITVTPLKSFAFWGDGGAGWANYAVLAKILAENIRRYQQIVTVIKQARTQERLFRDLNSGIKNSIGLLKSLPIKDEKILAELQEFEKAYQAISDLYGVIPKSPEEAIHKLHDRSIAESLKMTATARNYVEDQEKNSIKLESQSREASPKGAARMNVQAQSKLIHSMAQLIKINSQMLKLESEKFALVNQGKKQNVSNYQEVSKQIKRSFKTHKVDFKTPNFISE